MTLIIGTISDAGVFMGGDGRLTSVTGNILSDTMDKITVKPNLLVGWSGNTLWRTHLEHPDHSHLWLNDPTCEELAQRIETHAFAKNLDVLFAGMAASVLLARQGDKQLCVLPLPGYSLLKISRSNWAVGNNFVAGIAVMDVLATSISARLRIEHTIKVVSNLDSTVSPAMVSCYKL